MKALTGLRPRLNQTARSDVERCETLDRRKGWSTALISR
jgi:hypothetical protein